MLVEASGVNRDGQNVITRWFLLAKDNAGPNIPIAAAAAMVRGLLENEVTQTGAHACVGLLNTQVILGELRHLLIITQEDEAWPDHPVLFRRLLGRHVDDLPQAVRSVHDQAHAENFSGTAVARCGRGLSARLLRWLVGLPKSGRYPVEVQISSDKTGETWTRQFGQARFSSRLQEHSTHRIFSGTIRPTQIHIRSGPNQPWCPLAVSSLVILRCPSARVGCSENQCRRRSDRITITDSASPCCIHGSACCSPIAGRS